MDSPEMINENGNNPDFEEWFQNYEEHKNDYGNVNGMQIWLLQ